MEILRFPGLGWEIPISRVAVSIGSLEIYWYGVIIAVGFGLGLWVYLSHNRSCGIHPDEGLDIILWSMLGAIVGARAYYVAFQWDHYKDNLKEIFNLRGGGLAIYGGIIGALIVAFIVCRSKKLPMLPVADAAFPGVMLGQAIGRWGNFFNMEAFGTNTTLPWGMYSEATRAYLMGSTVTAQSGVTIDPNLPVHPTFLYESIWCFVGFLLLFRYIKKRRFNGDIALRYMIWYGAGRFWIEALRTDSLMLVPSIGLRASQLVAGIAVVAGVAAEIYFTHKFKDKPLMVELALNADNKAAMKKLDGPIAFAGSKTQLLASSPRKLFVERTEAYNAEVKRTIAESGKAEK